MTVEEQKQVAMLVFAEQILVRLANVAKPKSRRQNRLMAAIKQLEQVDRTYTDDMTEEQILSLEEMFNRLEQTIVECVE